MNKRFALDYPAAPEGVSPSEWDTRLQLAACYRIVDYFGWTSVVYNHITCRIPQSDALLINPFGLRYDEIRASDLIKIDINGNKINDSSCANDWPVNKAGYLIHCAIHQARPDDLHCIIHTHEAVSQALCATQSELIPVTQEGCQFYQRVGYHDFAGIVLHADEQERLRQALGQQNHTLVLKNHGLLTAGTTPTWAFVRHYAFIRNAQVQLQAMASGPLNRIDEAVMAHTRDQFEGGAAQAGAQVRHPEWPALLRLIDRLDPSWKT